MRDAGSRKALNPAFLEEAVMGSETRNKTSLLQVRTNNRVESQLDDVRRAEKDIPTRAEMVRRLIIRAYEKLKR